jgi:hypothetical protein
MANEATSGSGKENPDAPKFRIVVEFQPGPEAIEADLAMYTDAVMASIKAIPAPNIELVNATIERED